MTEPRASREQAGDTQEQAAARLPVSLRTWRAWEQGENPIPPDRLRLYRHLAGLERIPFRRAREASSTP